MNCWILTEEVNPEMYDINKYPAESGRVIGEDGKVYNLADLLQGGAAVSDGTYDVNKYPAKSGRVIGEDGKLYNLVDLLKNGSDIPDGSITTEKIANGAVTAEKIAPGVITEPDLSGVDPIADPSTATVEDVANAFNLLLNALKG